MRCGAANKIARGVSVEQLEGEELGSESWAGALGLHVLDDVAVRC